MAPRPLKYLTIQPHPRPHPRDLQRMARGLLNRDLWFAALGRAASAGSEGESR
jgi:hypothetical protein